MTARTVSNQCVVPRLIAANDVATFDSLGLQPENVRAVLRGLEQVTRKGGTAASSAINVDGARMGGKTGTSQVRSISRAERESGVLSNEELKWNMRNHGIFVGYAPTNSPRYAVSVITEHAGTSGPAAHTVAKVMRELLKDKK